MTAPRATLLIQTFDRDPARPYLDTDEAAALLAGGCGCSDGLESAASFAVDAAAPAGPVRWQGVIGMEDEMTGDGRLIESNALWWENLPIPLRHVPSDVGAHDGAVVVGRILTIERGAGGRIEATGDFDTASTEGREAMRQVEEGLTPGISMDLDSVSFEVRVAKELLEDLDSPPTTAGPVEKEVDEDGRVTVLDVDADSEVMVTTSARIRAATLVAIPAFASARIEVDESSEIAAETEEEQSAEDSADDEQLGDALALVAASSIPVEPPAAWFSDPGLSEPTPLVVTPEGRVFGHLAVWGTCHTAFPGQCVEPPRSSSGYAHFRRGSVLTAEGSEVACGVLTMDTLHADRSLRAVDTMAHYENTGRGVADVAAGEDSWGIWVAGALRPGVTPEQIRTLRASPLSGDWRRQGGSLELVAALAVNVPGFPIPRPQGLVASGVMTALVASGMLPPHQVVAPGSPGAFSSDDLRYLKRLVARERRAEDEERAGIQSAADALATRVRATRVAAMARRLGVAVR